MLDQDSPASICSRLICNGPHEDQLKWTCSVSEARRVVPVVCMQAVLLVIPLNTATPKIMQRFIRFSVIEGIKYHNLSLHIEDPEALKPGRPYVVGARPL